MNFHRPGFTDQQTNHRANDDCRGQQISKCEINARALRHFVPIKWLLICDSSGEKSARNDQQNATHQAEDGVPNPRAERCSGKAIPCGAG
jgi:hypothetical protein